MAEGRDMDLRELARVFGAAWDVLPLDPGSLEAAARAGSKQGRSAVFFAKELGSTSQAGRGMLRFGVPSPAWVIIAGVQSSGRGRMGRTWHSDASASLCFTLARNLGAMSRAPGILSLTASLALAEAAKKNLGDGAPLDIRWPNDLMLSGAKAAGILVESTRAFGELFHLIGVGVNVGPMGFPPEVAQPATFLESFGGRKIGRPELLRSFLEAFDDRLERFAGEGAGIIVGEYLRLSSYASGKAIRFRRDKEWAGGVTEGVNASGALLCRLDSGERAALHSCDIEALRPDDGAPPRRVFERKRFREYALGEGWTAVVGRSDEDNDLLSLELAEPEDWWFHVIGCPGSHVILLNRPGAMPPREVLEKAAAMAAWHSKARNSSRAEVGVCRAAAVSKRPNQPAGQVMVNRETVMKVRPGLPSPMSPIL